jgi:VWFA-related protein
LLDHRTSAVLLLLFAVMAQTPAPQFKSGVDVVRFDVVVLDKARHPIAGLTVDDFHVAENGKPLRIAGFQAVTILAGRSAPPPSSSVVDPRVDTVRNQRLVPGRLVVIVLDRTIPYEWATSNARAIANAAIDSLGPNDFAAVVFTSGLPIGRPQGFTNNRDHLRAAVASLQMGTPTNVDMSFAGLKRGGPHYNEGECFCGLCTIEALTRIASSLAPVQDYHKMMLFIGDDVALSQNSGLASSADCKGRTQDAAGKLFSVLDRGNVTIHAFDPRGIEESGSTADNTPPESADSRQRRTGDLATLPDYTGGRLITNTNEPARLVPGIFEESRTYYVLALERAPATKAGRPHTIDVRVDRNDATVLSRRTYLDSPPETAKTPPADPLERAIEELLPRTDIPLQMRLEPSAVKGSSVDVTFSTPRTAPARADVLIGVFDQFAKQVGIERAQVDLPARGDGSDVEWKMRLNPKPGRYEIRAAVRIGEQIGSVVGYVEVAKPRQ